MQSFRTEIENPLVQKDIIELEKKNRLFKEGELDEEKFRSLGLARGVYGQRQLGVQMIRIKIPYGKMTTDQLLRIADVSDEYSKGRLHTTNRQDIQIQHVSLDRTPQLWEDLEKSNVTLREACGNAVRNVVASPLAGIDKLEALTELTLKHLGIKQHILNPNGSLKSNINLLVDDTDFQSSEKESLPLSDNSLMAIVPIIYDG